MRLAAPRNADAVVPRAFRRYLWPLLLRHRWPILAAITLTGIHGGAMALQNLYPKWFFAEVIDPPALATAERWRRVAWLSVGYLAVSVVMRMGFWHVGYRLFTWARERIVFSLRSQFFRHINHLCLRFHDRHSSGELFSYLFGTPLANLMQFFQHTSVLVPGSAVTVAWTLGVLWFWDPVVGGLLTCTSLCSVILMVHSRRQIQGIQREFQSVEGDVSGRVADLLRGNKAVKLHGMEAVVLEDFEQRALSVGRKSYQRDVKGHIEWMKQEGFGYLCYVALMAVCAWRANRGGIETGIVVSSFTSFQGLYGPLQQLFQAFVLWGGASASLDRIARVLDTSSTTPDPTDPEETVPPESAIVFANVTFGYDPDRPVIRDLDLTIPYGQTIAFVGRSGSGKTTLAQLALRLYDPQQGEVRIGDTDARRFVGSNLRRHFGVVPQDPFIFRASVRDNVRVARPDASEEAIRAACELANAWEFIDRLPGRLDAPVGEGGSSLSGGQRQRLAIARALLADPPMFVFDEATSALDTLSEKLIHDALERSVRGRTAILIAHRLATVKPCDRILVLDAGQIVQDGSYADLTGTGLFAELARGQELA